MSIFQPKSNHEATPRAHALAKRNIGPITVVRVLPSPMTPPPAVAALDRYIVASPYADDEHCLDVQTLGSRESELMARALVHLEAVRDDYATAPYTESFNWGVVMSELKKLAREADHEWRGSSFYIVAFRSRIPPTTVYADLGVLDKAAHREAVQSGGLLKYWFGFPDDSGRNLATCVWRSKDDAAKGGVGPAHRRAAGATRMLYDEWGIDRHRLTVSDSMRSWEITAWAD